MSYLALISGGASSGKSLYAENFLSERALKSGGEKFYIATLKRNEHDPEILARIQKHEAKRFNKNFITLEREKNFAYENILAGANILLESLTNWLANEFFNDVIFPNEQEIFKKLCREIDYMHKNSNNLVIVSDDIFCDGIIYDDLTEKFLKCLAKLEIYVAEKSNLAAKIISGRILRFR